MRIQIVAVTVALVGFYAQGAYAQSVFLPQDDSPVAAQPAPVQPSPSPNTAEPAPFSKPNTVGATRSVAPRMAQRGTTSPAGAVPAVRGMSPEQIAQARQAFEALAAKNPQIAAINPFARMEAMQSVRALQKDISKRVREACKLKFFNVMIPNEVGGNKAAFDNMKGYGANAVVSAMGGLCSDEKMKKSLEEGVGVFNMKHKAGQVEPDIDGGVMMLTFTYDFTLPEPPKMPVMRQKLEKAMAITGDATTAAYNSYQDIDQDEMDSRMEKNLGIR